jgi:hypothetical protein
MALIIFMSCNKNTQVTIFTNMPTLIGPSGGNWPISCLLPYPTELPLASNALFPNIFDLKTGKKLRKNTACPHFYRKHYAKNMCNNCYHRLGRDKNAWNCEHSDRKHYAKGFCQNCYLKHYNEHKNLIEAMEEVNSP